MRKTILTVCLVAILLAIYLGLNIWVQSLNINPFDFTQEQRYTLSDESKEQVKNVEEDVIIYFFGYTEESTAFSLAKQYNNVNSHITAEVVNITERPDLAQTYGITSEDSIGIVVQSEQRYKVLSSSELYTYDYTTYETIDMTEQKLTNAILDTTIADKPKVYFLTGHNEYSIDYELYTLAAYIQNDVNDIETLNLLTTAFPEDCDTLVIASPTSDFQQIEVDAITNYIQNGGNILWMSDILVNDVEMPNVQKILDLYGVSIGKGVLLETDSSKMLVNRPDFIIPTVISHEITQDVYDGTGVVLPKAGKIILSDTEELEELKVDITPIIQSTETSFYREDFNVSTTSSDQEGVVTIALEAEKEVGEDTTSKLILFANKLFVTNEIIPVQNYNVYPVQLANNKDIVLNSIAYLTDRGDTIRIRKDTGYVTYTATQQQDNIIRAIIFGVPVLIIIIGIVIWQVRRRKK